MAKILIVDDEMGIRELLSEILRDEGHDVQLAENAAAARTARAAGRPDLVLLDIWMPDTDGITLLREWGSANQLTMPVVMMSGHATIDTAVEATRIGALDFLEKPIGMQKLLATVKKALERGAERQHGDEALQELTRVGVLRDLKRRMDQLLAKQSSLLLRSKPDGIIELLGRTTHVAGRAWIDLAQETQPLALDALQRASGGVLWCEELGRLTRLQQKNLVFALDRLERHNLRLLAGTHHTQAELEAQGWDEAALNRLFATTLGVPALADMADDIPELATHLLKRYIDDGDVPARHLTVGALTALRRHGWPGGYGELRGAVKSLALACLNEDIEEADVMQLLAPAWKSDEVPGLPSGVLDLPLREAREIFERMYFEYHLARDGNHMTRLAERTGLERTHLYRKLKDLGLR
jgi:DNA-binding NtrC family response regulator